MMDAEKSEAVNIENMEETTPLSDVRRTRTKSTGRPPSSVFLKENALQRCISLECDLSDDAQEYSSSVKETNNSILNELIEVTHTKKEGEERVETESYFTRRTNFAIPPKHVIKEEIPWMKEFLKKREHKRSLIEEDKKNIEEFVKNHEINKKTKVSRRISSFKNLEQNKNEEQVKNGNSIEVNKKSVEENIVTKSRMVVNETNLDQLSNTVEMHRISTITESIGRQNGGKKPDPPPPNKKPVELPKVDLKQTDLSKLETSKPELDETNTAKDPPHSPNHQISAPQLPVLTENLNDIEDEIKRIEEKKSDKIQKLTSKLKDFEEACSKRMKSLRNDIKLIHREVAAQNEYIVEFVKSLEEDLASINKDD